VKIQQRIVSAQKFNKLKKHILKRPFGCVQLFTGFIFSDFNISQTNKIFNHFKSEEGLISNTGISKTESSNLISKTAISKMVFETKSYLHYKPSYRCL